MLPELSRVFSAPISEVSKVISFFAIAYGLMQLFYGPLGDRFGKYRVVMLATMGCGVGSLFSAFSTDLPFLVATRIGTALAAAAIGSRCTRSSARFTSPVCALVRARASACGAQFVGSAPAAISRAAHV
jgi:MFS family permease